jgi:hypothetical protein
MKSNKLILKFNNYLNYKKQLNYIAYFLLYSLIIINFLLLHKYNIFVGDDAYLLSFINKFNFLEKTYSILCENIEINQLLIKTIGPFYKAYFGTGLNIIKLFNLELIWIRIFSFFLYLLAFFWFTKISKKSKYNFYFIIIFLTLEPYIVMAHSLRHDIVIFLGVTFLFFYILSPKKEFYQKFILFLSWNLLITHPSGYPFLIISAIYELFFNKKNILYSALLGFITILIFLYFKNFLKLENIYDFLNLIKSHNASTGVTREEAFTLEKFYDYFWLAKYKRHLFEIFILLIYLLNFLYFKKLNLEKRFILLTPILAIIIFQVLKYFNISYLKHIYLACIICTIMVSAEINYNKFSNYLIKITAILYFLLFLSISFIFLPHNSWKNLNVNYYRMSKYTADNKIISAPFYFFFIKENINFIPISALGNNNNYCFPDNISKNKIDTIILDTQILNKIKNNDPQYIKINDHLKNYRLVEIIYIGRLATQNIDKSGYIYIYTKIN